MSLPVEPAPGAVEGERQGGVFLAFFQFLCARLFRPAGPGALGRAYLSRTFLVPAP